MTEREILEAAALAARLCVVGDWEFLGHFSGLCVREDDNPGGYCWNPKNNQGQALELAANLRLRILPGKHLGDGCTVEAQGWGVPVASCTAFRDNPTEQMCIAILRVAAEIGVTICGYKPKEKEKS